LKLTKSQINKLGDKLRSAPELDAGLLEQLQQFRGQFEAPMTSPPW
jgi:hypothetical protein